MPLMKMRLIVAAIILLLAGALIWWLSNRAPEKPKYDYKGWRTYTSQKYGYTVKYPGDCKVVALNANEMVEFLGPEVTYNQQGERWPRLAISHYLSSFYHPPAGTDVWQWTNKLVGYRAGPEVSLAGRPTVHLVQDRTSQGYAADYYYFIKGDQLYQLSVLHTADQKDPLLYDKFLSSFRFFK
jgi:hypothetical protein